MSNEFQDAELAKRYGVSLRTAAKPSASHPGERPSAPPPSAGAREQTVVQQSSAAVEPPSTPDTGSRGSQQSRVRREEFELAGIREFSHSGHHLGVGVSVAERRERIRMAILREGKAHQRWHDSEFTYAEVFAQAYQQKLAGDESDNRHASATWRAALDEDSFDDEEGIEEGDATLA